MQSAGWSIGADGIATKAGKRFSATFYVRNDAPIRAMAVGIIAEQARAIGMDLQPAPVPFYNPAGKTSFFHPLKKGPFYLAFTGFASAPHPDPFDILHPSHLHRQPD